MKTTKNLNLNADLSSLAQPILKRLSLIIFLALIGLLGYTVYFVSNLFFDQADLDTLSKHQDTTQTKQIKFNQATIESLDKLVPAGTQPSKPTTNGRSNPFAPL